MVVAIWSGHFHQLCWPFCSLSAFSVLTFYFGLSIKVPPFRSLRVELLIHITSAIELTDGVHLSHLIAAIRGAAVFNITLQRNVFLSFQEFANTLSWYPLASESARSVVNAWNSLLQEVRLFFLQHYLTFWVLTKRKNVSQCTTFQNVEKLIVKPLAKSSKKVPPRTCKV